MFTAISVKLVHQRMEPHIGIVSHAKNALNQIINTVIHAIDVQSQITTVKFFKCIRNAESAMKEDM
jgi:hypothetical protein